VVLPGGPDWPELARCFSVCAGEGAGRRDRRAIIVVDVDRIADSCGYAVPLMELTSERDLLAHNAERQSLEELAAYRTKHNVASIDGLPALTNGATSPPGVRERSRR
jgi:hypothetical protein